MISARSVERHFGKNKAIDGVSFTLDQGRSLALWGSNGAGKTTLIRCLLGVIRFRGQVEIAGRDVRRSGKAVRACVGYVPQELAFHDDARVGESMRFFARLRGVPGGRASELLERVRLPDQERKRVRDLSGGMKQRLALAIALLSDPPIILLDEPTSNLDASGRRDVVEMLAELKQAGKTLLLASHRPDEVIALADRVLVIERGRVQADTTPKQLWPSEAAVQVVRLHVADGEGERAAQLLRNAGHAVDFNGHGLCVAVPRTQKASPIRVLTLANVEVRDFEFFDDLDAEEVRS
ncbi:MAG: ABC transporter ATP-binding protein [Phycisphaerales bacterium]|nr:ABC transporter ATP-binding protein [Phycisphaerales bacterium]